MSASLSVFLDRRSAFRRRSRRGFSERVLYVSLKCMAASSSFGRASRRDVVEEARAGRVDERVERCVEEVITDLWERLERDWRERRTECEVWVRDCGSVDVRETRGRVVRRFRYAVVVDEEVDDGAGRGEGGEK